MTVQINGTTGASLVQDTTITQGKLATGVACTAPAFSATLSANQTVTPSTYTKIAFNVKEFDTANAFDAVTNNRFQPLVAGYYQVNGMLSQASTVGFCVLYKNGSPYLDGTRTDSAGATYTSSVNTLVFLNGSTDYIELFGFTGTSPFVGGATGLVSKFQAVMVRGQ